MRSVHDPRYIEMVARMRAGRESRSVSQRELAARLGRPQSYIAKIETCERRVDLLEVVDYCTAVGLPLAEVIPSEGDRT